MAEVWRNGRRFDVKWEVLQSLLTGDPNCQDGMCQIVAEQAGKDDRGGES